MFRCRHAATCVTIASARSSVAIAAGHLRRSLLQGPVITRPCDRATQRKLLVSLQRNAAASCALQGLVRNARSGLDDASATQSALMCEQMHAGVCCSSCSNLDARSCATDDTKFCVLERSGGNECLALMATHPYQQHFARQHQGKPMLSVNCTHASVPDACRVVASGGTRCKRTSCYYSASSHNARLGVRAHCNSLAALCEIHLFA